MNAIHFSFSSRDNFLSIVQGPAQTVSYTSRSGSPAVVSGKLNISASNKPLNRLLYRPLHALAKSNTQVNSFPKFQKLDKLGTCHAT